MSLPPAPPYPAAPTRASSTSTQELPVPPPAVAPTTGSMTQVLPTADPIAPAEAAAADPAPVTARTASPGHEPTGPVDFVPNPPEPGSARTGSTVTARKRTTRDRAAFLGLGLGVVTLGLLEVGLLLDFGAPQRLWSSVPLWSGFATLAALLGLLAFAGPLRSRPSNDRAWKLSAAGLSGLAVFWVLVVLPIANTDRGFVLTAALACLGVALWIAPGRKV